MPLDRSQDYYMPVNSWPWKSDKPARTIALIGSKLGKDDKYLMGQRRRPKSGYKDAGGERVLVRFKIRQEKNIRFQTKTRLCEEKVVGLAQIYLGWPAARNWEQPLTAVHVRSPRVRTETLNTDEVGKSQINAREWNASTYSEN